MKQFSLENSYIFPQNELKSPIFLRKKSYINSYIFYMTWLTACIRVAKTKALISFTVTVKLICAFVFTYADCWFSHAAAQMLYCFFSHAAAQMLYCFELRQFKFLTVCAVFLVYK